MRRLAILLLLSACGARATGPAWPKSAGTERVGLASDDGGESLEPRVPQAAAAIEGPSDPDPVPETVAAPAAKPAAAPAEATPAAPAATDPSAPIILDYEETIEIDAK